MGSSLVRRSVSVALVAAWLGASGAQAATHPDLSGTWSLPFEVHSSGVPLASGSTPWLPASAGDPHRYHIPTLQEMSARVDQSVREHHGNPTFALRNTVAPPLTAAGKAAAARMNPAAMQRQELNCYPSNVLARVGGGFAPLQIVQGATAIALVPDGYFPARLVYLDGRPHDQLPPQWNGLSTGHWQGQTLHVETVSIRGEELQAGYPISEHARLIEDYHLEQGGKVLEIDATFEDPTYYTEPLHRLYYLQSRPDLQLTDYSCEEGKADMIESAGSAPAGTR